MFNPMASSCILQPCTDTYESGEAKEVQEQLHKAAGALKMLQGVVGGLSEVLSLFQDFSRCQQSGQHCVKFLEEPGK